MGHHETAVNRRYYSVYYAVIASLLKEGKNPKTHHGTKKLFSQIFVNDKNFNNDLFDFYSELLNDRETPDYDMFYQIYNGIFYNSLFKIKIAFRIS